MRRSRPPEYQLGHRAQEHSKTRPPRSIDGEGRFRGAKVLLRLAPETRAEIGPEKGARHSSAAEMSVEALSLAITVSQDGSITAYGKARPSGRGPSAAPTCDLLGSRCC